MSEERAGPAKGLLSSALLVAAVGAILLAGLVLRTSGRTEPVAPPPAPSPPALPLGSEIAKETAEPEPTSPEPTSPEPSPAEPPPAEAAAAAPVPAPPPVVKEIVREPELDPLLVKLAARAEADAGRLSRAKGRFTAQLMVACKPETVDRLLTSAGGAGKLYLLPARVKNDACFRVCFGDYATSKDAAAAADLPPALRGKDKIGVAEIAKVLR